MAELEIHRVVAEASGNPFLRAASAVMEFGVAVSVLARLNDDLTAPLGGLAEAHAAGYEALIRAIERGDREAAAAQITALTR